MRHAVAGVVLALLLLAAYLTWQAALSAGAEAGLPAPGASASTGTPAPRPAEAPAVGYPAPDFTALTLDGGTLRLRDLRGRPVLLNFWATWCEPCRVEMPALQRVHEAYGDRVAIVGVNLQEPADVVRTFVEGYGYTWTFVLDPDFSIADRYRIRPIPTSVFIDADGVIRHIEYGALSESTIRGIFDRLLARTSDQ